MDKKADLPVMVLVIGIVGVCILTILSFVKFDNERQEDFVGPGLIETINSVALENNFIIENPIFKIPTKFEDGFKKSPIAKDKGPERITEIKITGNEIIGTYTIEEQNIISSCDGKTISILEKCVKELMKITYPK